jgi:hypothetical protein
MIDVLSPNVKLSFASSSKARQGQSAVAMMHFVPILLYGKPEARQDLDEDDVYKLGSGTKQKQKYYVL